jgi:acetamidase/formamidase
MDAHISHKLKATPPVVHWGYLSSELKPVLSIQPGDTVLIETLSSCCPEEYQAAGVPLEKIPHALIEICRIVKDRGPAAHILLGPIKIEGAEPGDVLEVRILETTLTLPFGYNRIRSGKGLLPGEFPYDTTRILQLDLERMTTEILPGVIVPLRPFFGIMAVAPPPDMGRVSSMSPGVFGGNMDNKELIAGTILYLPVHVPGALFSAGDGHAVQGDGEVNLTALETPLTGVFQFFIQKKRSIKWPRAETPTHFITMGLHEDLDVAAEMAVREAIEFLGETRGMKREDAYILVSLAADLHVTQVVDGVKGIHVMIPKSIFSQ